MSVTAHIDKLHTRLETRVLSAAALKEDPLGRLLTDGGSETTSAAGRNFIHGAPATSNSAFGGWLFTRNKGSQRINSARTSEVLVEGKFRNGLARNPRLRKWLVDETQNEFST